MSSIALSDFLSISPKAAVQFAYDALKSDRDDLSEMILLELKEALLPKQERMEESDPYRQFWQEALKRDCKPWLELCFKSLTKEEAKVSAKALLMLAAKAKAFESFDYLLSLGAARRSWKILQSAYLHGGHKVAEKVKKPTAAEAYQMLSDYNHEPEKEDMLWVAKFLKKETEAGAELGITWIERLLVQVRSDELANFALENKEIFKMVSPDEKHDLLATLGNLLREGGHKTAMTFQKLYMPLSSENIKKLSEPLRLNYLKLQSGSNYQYWHVRSAPITTMMMALFGEQEDFLKHARSMGAVLPTAKELDHLLKDSGVSQYNRAPVEVMVNKAKSFLEKFELGEIVPEIKEPIRSKSRSL